MKTAKNYIATIFGLFLLVLNTSCGGGGSSSSTGNSTPPPEINISKVTISGYIEDNDSLEPLSNAKVTVQNSTAQTSSDENGNFTLEIETNKSSVLVNTTAPGFSSNQKEIQVNEADSSSTPFANITLKSSSIVDTLLLTSIASSGKKGKAKINSKKFETGVSVPLTQVEVNVRTESNLVPGNATTDESETNLDFLSIVEIALINPNTNETIVDAPSDFVYDLKFSFTIEETDLDLAGLPLWYFDKSLGKWKLVSNPELVSFFETDGVANIIYKVKKTGWFALGKRILGLACIKGRVVDQLGNSIAGASVVVEGVSFNGKSYGFTNKNGIFEIKTKPGSTVKVHASFANSKTDQEMITIQNYLHNHDGAASGTYCQPAGPTDKTDSFYTTFSNFTNLVPPTGFNAALSSNDTPLTLQLSFHKFKGVINYITSSGSKPLPKTTKDLKPTYLSLKNFGQFQLTKDGEIEFSVPLKESTSLTAFISFKEDNIIYTGKTEIKGDISESVSNFTLTLEPTTLSTFSGLVTFNGLPANNATVNFSTGQAISTNETGEYKIEIPTALIPSGTNVTATFKQLNTGLIYFSDTKTTNSDLAQTINLEVKAHAAQISGAVVDQSNTPIPNAKILFLIDEKPLGLTTITNSLGEYLVLLPVKSSGVTQIKIIATVDQSGGSKISSNFTILQINNDNSSEEDITQYTADKIVLDLSSRDTKVKGKILLNGVFQPKVLIIFSNTKTETGENGAFEANVNSGDNILSVIAGNEPVLLDAGKGNQYAFSATQGETTDLGTLTASSKRNLLFFMTNQFQKTSAIEDLPIKNTVGAANSFVFFQLKAKGSKESPKISLSHSSVTLLKEITDPDSSTTTNIYQVSTATMGVLNLKFEASESDGNSIIGSNSILISSENLAPVILAIKQERTQIESTNQTGIAFAVSAMDPEGDTLSYNWNIESPNDSTAEISGAATSSILLKTNQTTANEIIISVTVSDAAKSVSRKFGIAVIKTGQKLLSFQILPGNTVGADQEVTVTFETDDTVPLSSVALSWGDGSENQNFKKSKVLSTTHKYAKEGTYAIEVILIDKNNEKSTFRKSILVSNSYKTPVLLKGTISTLEDTLAKLDLNSLIENFDKTKSYKFTIVKAPTLGRATLEGNTLFFAPYQDVNGFDLMLVKVFDGISSSNDIDLKISITPVNDVPKLIDGSFNASLGVTLQIDLKKQVLDPDVGDVHNFKIISEPSQGTATIEGNILSYLGTKSGMDSMTIICFDGTDKSNEAKISFNNNEVLKNLLLTGGNFETTQNTELGKDLTPFLTNPDGLKPITYAISQQGLLGEAFISGSNLIYVPIKNITGDDKITIIAKTENGQATEPALFSIKINPINQAPILRNENFTLKQGDSILIDLTKIIANYDANKTYLFNFTSSGKPLKGDALIDNLTLRYTPFANETGIDNISLIAVSDNLKSNISLLTLTIDKVIQKPIITSVPITTVNEGSLYLYNIIANHPGNLPLTYGIKEGPAWLSLTNNQLSGTPLQLQVGKHLVIVFVSDGTNVVAQEFTVEVIDVNFPPFFNSKPPTTAIPELLYSYQLKGSDPDGDIVSFKLVDGPANMVLDTKTFLITWIPKPTDPLNNPVAVEISDGNLTRTQKWSIDITISAPKIISFVAADPDDGDNIFSVGDTITINFDQGTNKPPASNSEEINILLKFNESIGSNYSGEWVSNSVLVITILKTGSAKPGIGSLRVQVNKEGNLLNAAGTSESSTSISDTLKGNWGLK